MERQGIRRLVAVLAAGLAVAACEDDTSPTFGGDAAAGGGTGGLAGSTAAGGSGGKPLTAPDGGLTGGAGGTVVAADGGPTGDGGALPIVTSTRGRLIVADNNPENPRFVVFDLDDGQKVVEFRALGATSVYSSGPSSGYGWAVQRVPGLTEVVASGLSAEGKALSKTAPWILGERLQGPMPTHWVDHEQWVVVFNDGDGTFDYVLESAFGTRRPLMSRASTGKAHHGLAVISHGNVFASIPNPDPAASTLPIGVSRRFISTPEVIADRSENCPGLHGEAANDEAVAFGCIDGILLAERKNDAFTFRKLPNPADAPAGRRVGTLRMKGGVRRLVGNWGNGFAIVSYQEANPTWIPVDIGSPNRGFYIEHSGNRLIVLAGDGTLRAYSLDNGQAIGAPLQVMEAWPTMGLPAGMPTPGLRLGDTHAYVADPRTGAVIEVDLVGWKKERTFTVGGWPSSVAAFGRWAAGN